MAFKNAYGQSISYYCKELIEELKQDIAEFGSNLILEVVTEQREGATIYKDYNFIDDDKETDFKLSENEKMQQMTAAALLTLYEIQNDIF